MYKVSLVISIVILFTQLGLAQPDRWQQRVEYTMDIDFDVTSHKFTGDQKIVYYNNSPDTLRKVFYHLYYNTFQPGSTMDVRSRQLPDPDARVSDHILHLKEDEIGYHRIDLLKQDGKKVDYDIEGTVVEVTLNKPILPNTTTTLEMEFNSQVPIHIRRTGRNNKEGIDYSMGQWYPKLAEYDYQGWHANPYVAREFYGVWGDFDVTINIDSAYMIAAGGVLQNPEEIGHGYPCDKPLKRPKGQKLTWKWKAENVHDFGWAADRDYIHTVTQVPNGPALHFFYQDDTVHTKNWEELPEMTVKAMQFASITFGEYPYPKYSVIQGGDSGMEYPMATLVTGHRSMKSLVSVTVHELLHAWYHTVLATNESLYAWMDEGFASFAAAMTKHHIYDQKSNVHPLAGIYNTYFNLAGGGEEEPLTTHADHFKTNTLYAGSTYSKGAVVLNQLCYLLSKDVFYSALKRYFNEWKFKHPNQNDFMRVMERHSGLELDWYFEHFVKTTNTIDYGIRSVQGNQGETVVLLEKIGRMPMPVELFVEYENGDKEIIYIPLAIMRGEKPEEIPAFKRLVYSDWSWTYPFYTVKLPRDISDIKSMEIDPTRRMADIDRSNNLYPFDSDLVIDGLEKP